VITFVRTPSDGFNLGCFVWCWKRFGPFMVYREMLSSAGTCPPLTEWRVAIFLSKAALGEFYEGASK
jgi:hypothetical protein